MGEEDLLLHRGIPWVVEVGAEDGAEDGAGRRVKRSSDEEEEEMMVEEDVVRRASR